MRASREHQLVGVRPAHQVLETLNYRIQITNNVRGHRLANHLHLIGCEPMLIGLVRRGQRSHATGVSLDNAQLIGLREPLRLMHGGRAQHRHRDHHVRSAEESGGLEVRPVDVEGLIEQCGCEVIREGEGQAKGSGQFSAERG